MNLLTKYIDSSSTDKKDIGENQIDPDVHAFTNPMVERLPLGRPENPPKLNPHYS